MFADVTKKSKLAKLDKLVTRDQYIYEQSLEFFIMYILKY